MHKKNAWIHDAFVKVIVKALNMLFPNEDYLIQSFTRSNKREGDRFTYQKKYINFNIKPGEKVLDVGSGGYPFPFATHLADLYEGETGHRTEHLVTDGRPFSIIDVAKMPYLDKEFDFVYCSHVLEHVPDPAKACEEIMRVGKRGYIETPTRTSDIMLNFTKLKGHHKWHVTMSGNALFFFEWDDKDRRDTGCNEFFKMLNSEYENPFQTLFSTNKDLFVNMLQWTDHFTYSVYNKSGKLVSTNIKNG